MPDTWSTVFNVFSGSVLCNVDSVTDLWSHFGLERTQLKNCLHLDFFVTTTGFSRLFAINISLNAQLGLGFVPTSVLLFANSHFVRRPLPSARTPPPHPKTDGGACKHHFLSIHGALVLYDAEMVSINLRGIPQKRRCPFAVLYTRYMSCTLCATLLVLLLLLLLLCLLL